MDEIINETLNDESPETPEGPTEEIVDESPETNLDTVLTELSRLGMQLDVLTSIIEEMLAPIRTYAQKDLPEANTSEESTPALYYL